MSHAMTGDGDYDRHSDYQIRAATSHTELVRRAAEHVTPDAQREDVVITDYGCAQGRSSTGVIRAAIEQVRTRHAHVPVCVYHNDLLVNDWTGLFERLRGDDTYLSVAGGPITPLVSATSFYERVTPRGIVDLGISFAAVQWLADPGPSGTGSAVYFDQLTEGARAEMAAQAHADWSRFLERRAEELAPGGRLVLDMMGTASDGRATGHDVWGLVRTIAQDLVAEGALDAGRLDAYVIPIYERSAEEVRRPFDGDLGRRLRLEHLASADVLNPVAERFGQDGDAIAFARDFVGFFRAFSEPSLREALSPPDGVIDELYRRLEARLRDEAADVDFTVHLLTAVIALV